MEGRPAGCASWATAPIAGPWSNVDYLAALYVQMMNHAAACSLHPAAVGLALPVREVAEAVARAAGPNVTTAPWPLAQAWQTLGPVADSLALDQFVAGVRAQQDLVWVPEYRTPLEHIA